MTALTLEQLLQIMPHSRSVAAFFVEPLNTAMEKFGIDTPERAAMFLAQVGHESGQLYYVRELATGAAYEGRKDLGNTRPGDGERFRGRGLIQITGRDNYRKCSIAVFGDERLLQNPALLEQRDNAALSAGWFWQMIDGNRFADNDDIRGCSRKVNGGYNGLQDRIEIWERAKDLLT